MINSNRRLTESLLFNEKLHASLEYHMSGNFHGVLIFMDFVGPTQTTKNSLKISVDSRNSFLGLETTNVSLFYIMHIAMLYTEL